MSGQDKNENGYLTNLPGGEWVETGVALELPHSEVRRLEQNVSSSRSMALAMQYSRDGIHWQYDPPIIGAKSRALLLRKPTEKARKEYYGLVEALFYAK